MNESTQPATVKTAIANTTPTPWSVKKSQFGEVHICALEKNVASVAVMFDSDYITPPEREANAELIVRAVNEHAALCAVAEAAKAVDSRSSGNCLHNLHEALANLEAVRKGE